MFNVTKNVWHLNSQSLLGPRSQDGHWLASFEVIPPQKLAPQRPNKLEFPNIENCCSCILFGFCSKNSGQKKFLLLFWMCLSEIASRRSAITTLSPANNKRSCSKKGTFQAKIGFFCFSGENFVTPFSTFANNKRSYPTNSTTPDWLWSRIRTNGEDFPDGFCPVFRASPKKVFQSDPRSRADIHPKRSPQPDVCDRVNIFCATNYVQKLASWGGE